MLPYTVNSPRYKGKSGKTRQSSTFVILGVVTLLLTGVGGLWYVKSKSAHVAGLLAVITEHETKFDQLTAENEKLDNEIRRLNRALEAAKADAVKVQGDITYRNTRIDEAETKWTAAATQLEALTKTHDGVLGQLKEAQERSELAEQETIEAAMKAAECRKQLNEATGAEPVLGELTVHLVMYLPV
ncbi:hypothetical protein ABBQ32_000477 [Trebouxia sp. C0010 RCD-2024]